VGQSDFMVALMRANVQGTGSEVNMTDGNLASTAQANTFR